MANPTLQANFSANTAGFSQGVSELRQKLNELNAAMESTKQRVQNTNVEIKQYEKELAALEKAAKNSSTATAEQQQQMQSLREKIVQTTLQLAEANTRIEENKRQIRETTAQTKEYEKELAELNKATKNGSAATTEQMQQMQALRDKISQSTSTLGAQKTAQQNLQSTVRNMVASLREYEKELTALEKAAKNDNTASAQQAARMTELRTKIAQATEQLGTLRSAEQDLRGQINHTNRALQEERTQLNDNAQAAATFGDVLKATLCSAAVQQAVGKLAEGLKSAAAYCYNVGSSFEAGMSQVGAVSGAAADELEALKDKARELGAQTKFTATEAAQAMNYMAMAGWDAQQMLDGIGGVMSLAAASGGDLALTSDIVTDAITAFGLKAEDVGHFSDVLAAASANANTNVAMMGETFKYCAPAAGTLGFSIEDVSEAIGLMANSGIKSTMAGTALRTLFTKLSKDVTVTGKSIGEITVHTSNADGSMRSLKDIVNDLRGAFSRLEPAERSAQAQALAGTYAYSGFLALMNAGAADVDKLRGAIESCGGASEQMAQTMQDNAAGAVTIMKSALEGLGIAVYDHFGEGLTHFVEEFTDVFSSLTQSIEDGGLNETFDELGQNLGAAADDFAEWAARFLPSAVSLVANLVSLLAGLHTELQAGVNAFLAYKGAALAVKTVAGIVTTVKSISAAIKAATANTTLWTAAQKGLNAAIAANPAGIIATAVAALVAGVTIFAGHLDDCNEKLRSLNDRAQELTSSARDYADKSESLRDVKKRYEEIKNSTEDAAEKEKELQALQDELNDRFGMMADSIDLVTGAFDRQAKKLDVLIDRYAALSEQDRKLALQKARSAEEESTAIKLGGMLFSTDNTQADSYFRAYAKGLSTYKNEFVTTVGGEVYFEGSFERRLADMNRLYGEMVDKYAQTGNEAFGTIADRLKEEITALEEGKQTLDALEGASQGTAAVEEGGGSYSAQQGYYGANSTAWQGDSELEAQRAALREGYYDEEKEQLDYLRDTGEVTTEEYAKRLTALRDKWLAEDTEKWRAATVAIYRSSGRTSSGADPNEQAYDDEKAYLKWRLDMGMLTEADYYEGLAKLRDRYLADTSEKWRSATLELHKYQLKQNQSKLDGIKSQYDDAVSAIDAQIKQRDRDREDEELSAQIADVDRQLEYARLDDYSRMQLEQKRRELTQQREDTEWERAREDEKAMLGTVYTMAKEAYDEGAADLEAALQTASAVFSAIGTGAAQTAATVSTVNNNSVSMIMNAVSQTSDQIAAAVIKALSSSI